MCYNIIYNFFFLNQLSYSLLLSYRHIKIFTAKLYENLLIFNTNKISYQDLLVTTLNLNNGSNNFICSEISVNQLYIYVYNIIYINYTKNNVYNNT